MSDLLGLGAAGVRAYQTALDIIGENISNANVAGYARRQAVVTENPSAGTGYPLVRDVKAGSGVNVSGVLRAYRSEEHTSELQSLMRISYAAFCLQKTTAQKPESQTSAPSIIRRKTTINQS